MTKRIAILGATGSVGSSTLDLVEAAPDRFDVVAVTAASNVEQLAAIARRTGAARAVIADPALRPALAQALEGSDCRPEAGEDALCEAAREADLVIAAIVGTAGLKPVMAALEAGVTVGLANKESLVSAGELMMRAARRANATILPVDSEHNAIFQCLGDGRCDHVERLILTASGGPFRTLSAAEMAVKTPAQAVAHPNWSMGAKISVDSATMMNKGLELIEAHHLFGLPSERIDIVVHPQSVVHSCVEYQDGSILAQMGPSDMRVPIAHCLAWPERMETAIERLDLPTIARLDFEAPDPERFPALRLARAALEAGGSAPARLNAANEVAVAAFLDERIGFADIAATVEAVLAASDPGAPQSIEQLLEIDAATRAMTRERVARLAA
ncbi:1-deoxy-D-xylulose-5-phosphate reductoisomerase [Sphingomicrobium astaxanthinifaciens]|uniref:1-deoxy-D-xylulose-5-phosphate reductoisomerase n=1 Tax=Sphingomicrobium astaxanthinifaciens TaxID=1227949 RepID=UPI001FCC4A19|nr:1-deoxy-D-xylulose-5-phosphate reductoisomerase [Sphingomicrobium astaxanthinifaciens]MCJ7420222.1 1-deoxy-D-xylulose-5-phosphate reductoisomerase [Sphingomicrobium astaxanthinifaciens]